MNAIELLTADHRTVEALFAEVKASNESKHPELFRTIRGELETHAHIEETMFYPRLKQQGKKDLADVTREGIEEHKLMHILLDELAAMNGKDREQFEAKLNVLMESVEHHATEEEDEMFPMVEDKYSDETLEAWGMEMQKEKERFQKANGIVPAPRKPATGTIGTIIEQAMEVVSGIFTGSSQESGEKAKASNASKTSSGRSSSKSAKSSKSSTGKASSSGSSKAAAASQVKGSGGKKNDGKAPAKASAARGNGKKVGSSSSKTSTKTNGGTRSNPPRVAGSGKGEAKSAKSRSASAASKTSAKGSAASKAASKPNSSKKTSPTKGSAKRTTRANAA